MATQKTHKTYRAISSSTQARYLGNNEVISIYEVWYNDSMDEIISIGVEPVYLEGASTSELIRICTEAITSINTKGVLRMEDINVDNAFGLDNYTSIGVNEHELLEDEWDLDENSISVTCDFSYGDLDDNDSDFTVDYGDDNVLDCVDMFNRKN